MGREEEDVEVAECVVDGPNPGERDRDAAGETARRLNAW